VIDRGELVILKMDSIDEVYLLQIGDFSYSIPKDMPVLESDFEEGALADYVLPALESYLVIRILSVPDTDQLKELNNFFATHTKFAAKETKKTTDEEKVKPEEATEPISVSSLIYKGGELIKNALIVGADYLARGLNAGGEYIQQHYLKKDHVEIGSITMTTLHYTSTATGWIVKLRKSKLKQLMNYGKEVLVSLAKRMTGPVPTGGADGIRQIGSATIHGFANIYEGMIEALDIIEEKGIHDTTVKLVEHRYGEKIGKLAQNFFATVKSKKQGEEFKQKVIENIHNIQNSGNP